VAGQSLLHGRDGLPPVPLGGIPPEGRQRQRPGQARSAACAGLACSAAIWLAI